MSHPETSLMCADEAPARLKAGNVWFVAGGFKLAGAVSDIASGEVRFLDEIRPV